MEQVKSDKYIKTLRNIENVKLLDIVTAFVHKQDLKAVLSKLDDQGFDEECVVALPKDEARKIIDVSYHGMSIMTRIQRMLDSIIGGGPAEFIRDIKRMSDRQYLLLIDVASEEEKDIVFSVLKGDNARGVKYFTQFYVEHGTVESDHRQMESAL